MVDCLVCIHPQKAAIEGLLEAGLSSWEAAPFAGLMPRDLSEHDRHVERDRRRDQELEIQRDENTPFQLSVGTNKLFYTIRWDTHQALLHAQKSGDSRTAQACVRQLQSLIALAAKLDSQSNPEADAEEEFLQNPKWTDFKMRLLRSLEMYPEAYRAVLESLDV